MTKMYNATRYLNAETLAAAINAMDSLVTTYVHLYKDGPTEFWLITKPT